MQRVTLHRTHQGQGDTSAASRVLDDRTARRQPAIGLGGGNHRQCHPVLHAASRVLRLQLDEDSRGVGRLDPAQVQHRRVADKGQDVIV